MNKLKLSLQNFQSISEGELVFQAGLNVIIGQSNSGKSATFRALKACLANPSGSQRFIKNGESKANVQLEYNGNVIEWQRSSKESSYVINGEKYHKTGSSNAFKILDDTGFTRDDNETIMNIEEELQLPFPFGISKSDLFKLFENVFCVSDSAVILKSAKENEDEVKSDLTSLELEKQKNLVKIKELKEFADFVNIEVLEKSKKFLIEKRDRLEFLRDGKDQIFLAVKLENSNFEVPCLTFDNLLKERDERIESKRNLKRTKSLHQLTTSLKALTFNTEEVRTKLNTYFDLIESKNTMTKVKQLNKLAVSISDFENKLTILNELKKQREYFNDLKQSIRDLEDSKKREEEKVQSIEDKLKEYKVCPLCHHSLED